MMNKRNSKIFSFVFLLLLTSAVLIGCQKAEEVQQTPNVEENLENNTINELEQRISEYENKIDSLQTELTYVKEANQYYIDAIKKLTANFTEEEMLEFAQSHIIYDLQVNGESIPKNGEMIIAPGDVVVLVSQATHMGSNFLDPEWHEKGRISGDYFEHILDFDATNWTLTGLDGTDNTALGYEKSDVKAGDRISFKVTDELKERLNLDTNLIQIEVN